MKLFTLLTVLTVLAALTSCDPSHDLKIDNQTGKPIEVLYSQSSNVSYFGVNKTEFLKINGRDLNKIILDSAETLRIGIVNARYAPTAEDLDIDFLEIRNSSDTIRLIGKHSILSTIQKVKKLDWRLIIK
jgi:hypothetical protein